MPASPFQIKVCGVTTGDGCIEAFRAGAEVVGLNFYPKSPRYFAPSHQKSLRGFLEETDQLRHSLDLELRTVGVFVNELAEEIANIAADLRLSGIQLHGDEPPEFLTKLPPDIPIIRARRMDDRGVAALAEDIEACRAAGRAPDAVLVDAFTPGRYGGTGETVSWAGLADHPRWLGDVPLILAGGLTPENVAEAIRIVRPAGVDVASGVESSPGVKDPDKIRRFVAAAREALET